MPLRVGHCRDHCRLRLTNCFFFLPSAIPWVRLYLLFFWTFPGRRCRKSVLGINDQLAIIEECLSASLRALAGDRASKSKRRRGAPAVPPPALSPDADSASWFDAVVQIHRRIAETKRAVPSAADAQGRGGGDAASGEAPAEAAPSTAAGLQPGAVVPPRVMADTIKKYHAALSISFTMDTEDVVREVRELFDEKPEVAALYRGAAYQFAALDPLPASDTRVLALLLAPSEHIALIRRGATVRSPAPSEDAPARSWEVAVVPLDAYCPGSAASGHTALRGVADSSFALLPTRSPPSQQGGAAADTDAGVGLPESTPLPCRVGGHSDRVLDEESPLHSSMLAMLSGTFEGAAFDRRSQSGDASQATVSPFWSQRPSERVGPSDKARSSAAEPSTPAVARPARGDSDGGRDSTETPTPQRNLRLHGDDDLSALFDRPSCECGTLARTPGDDVAYTPSQATTTSFQSDDPDADLLELLSGDFGPSMPRNDAGTPSHAATPHTLSAARTSQSPGMPTGQRSSVSDGWSADTDRDEGAAHEQTHDRSQPPLLPKLSPGNGGREPYATVRERHAARVIIRCAILSHVCLAVCSAAIWRSVYGHQRHGVYTLACSPVRC
jgi:hypothetical protein